MATATLERSLSQQRIETGAKEAGQLVNVVRWAKDQGQRSLLMAVLERRIGIREALNEYPGELAPAAREAGAMWLQRHVGRPVDEVVKIMDTSSFWL